MKRISAWVAMGGAAMLVGGCVSINPLPISVATRSEQSLRKTDSDALCRAAGSIFQNAKVDNEIERRGLLSDFDRDAIERSTVRVGMSWCALRIVMGDWGFRIVHTQRSSFGQTMRTWRGSIYDPIYTWHEPDGAVSDWSQ